MDFSKATKSMLMQTPHTMQEALALFTCNDRNSSIDEKSKAMVIDPGSTCPRAWLPRICIRSCLAIIPAVASEPALASMAHKLMISWRGRSM